MMTAVELKHLERLCKQNDIDTKEIDTEIDYWENKDYLCKMIPGSIPERRKYQSVSSIIREKIEENMTIDTLQLFFAVAAERTSCPTIRFLLKELEKNSELIDLRPETVVWMNYQIKKEGENSEKLKL